MGILDNVRQRQRTPIGPGHAASWEHPGPVNRAGLRSAYIDQGVDLGSPPIPGVPPLQGGGDLQAMIKQLGRGPLTGRNVAQAQWLVRDLQKRTPDYPSQLDTELAAMKLGIAAKQLPDYSPFANQTARPVSPTRPAWMSGDGVLGVPASGQQPTNLRSPAPDYLAPNSHPPGSDRNDWLVQQRVNARRAAAAAQGAPETVQGMTAAYSPETYQVTHPTAMGSAASQYGSDIASRMYSDADLASQVTPQTYQGLRASQMRQDAGSALAARNTGVYESMGQPNPAGARADSILGGQRAAPQQAIDSSVWGMPGGRQYAGVGRPLPDADPNLPAVKPNWGQTAAEAQQAYQQARQQSVDGTQQRIGEMMASGQITGEGPYRMQYKAPGSRNVLDVTRRKSFDGRPGYTISGSIPSEIMAARPSILPGAKGRTNAEMEAVRRERMKRDSSALRDRRILARANRNDLGSNIPAVRQAAENRGIRLAGMPRPGTGQGAGPGINAMTIASTMQGLGQAAQNPVFNMVSPGFNPAQAQGDDWTQMLQSPMIGNLANQDQATLQRSVAMALQRPDLQGGDRELMEAFSTGGYAGVQSLMQNRQRQAAARTIEMRRGQMNDRYFGMP